MEVEYRSAQAGVGQTGHQGQEQKEVLGQRTRHDRTGSVIADGAALCGSWSTVGGTLFSVGRNKFCNTRARLSAKALPIPLGGFRKASSIYRKELQHKQKATQRVDTLVEAPNKICRKQYLTCSICVQSIDGVWGLDNVYKVGRDAGSMLSKK